MFKIDKLNEKKNDLFVERLKKKKKVKKVICY